MAETFLLVFCCNQDCALCSESGQGTIKTAYACRVPTKVRVMRAYP